jgi:Glycosyltransferase (GlcNAc)
MSIFLAIPSYCDPVLNFTLANAYEKAKFPDQLHFAVIDQSPLSDPYPVPAHIPAAQVSYLKIEATQSKGCCWARNVAMSLYKDEDYFFQLDSHMMFGQDWDEIMVRKMKACLNYSDKAVISSYPAAFRFVDGVATPDLEIQSVRAAVVNPGEIFHWHPYFKFKLKLIKDKGAVQGYHIAGGCMFAPGDFVKTIPNDPYLYFNEEEQNIALRLYTHGWDIYHVSGMPIYHLYNEAPEKTGTVRRPLHWDTAPESTEKPKWWAQDQRAKQRLSTLVWGDSSQLGIYGLGTERTLQEYAAMCGIDYAARTFSPKAFEGPWDLADKVITPAPKPGVPI